MKVHACLTPVNSKTAPRIPGTPFAVELDDFLAWLNYRYSGHVDQVVVRKPDGSFEAPCPCCNNGQHGGRIVFHADADGYVTDVTDPEGAECDPPECTTAEILSEMGLAEALPFTPADRYLTKKGERIDLGAELKFDGESDAAFIARRAQEQIERARREHAEARRVDLLGNALWFDQDNPPDMRMIDELDEVLKAEQRAQDLDAALAPPFDGTIEAIPWLVPDWIPRGAVTLLTGRGGAGKSRLVLQLAVQGAQGAGRLVFGDVAPLFKTALHFRTLYLSWEDPAAEYHRRLSSHVNLEGKETDAARAAAAIVNDNIRYYALQPHGPLWKPIASGSGHTSTQGEPSKLWARVEVMAADFRPGLIVIDTAAAAYVLNENDRGLVRQFINALGELAARLNAAILLISHPSKSSTVSGSTDWENGVRTVLQLERNDQGLQLKHTKANYAPIQDPVLLSGDHYPYHAVKPLPPELEDATAGRLCAGYGDYVCDQEPEGRKKRCRECQQKFEQYRRGRAPR